MTGTEADIEPLGAEFVIGDRPAADFPLPASLPKPSIDCSWDESNSRVSLRVEFGEDSVCLNFDGETPDCHFHAAGGPAGGDVPWDHEIAVGVVDWALELANDLWERMPGLNDEVEEAMMSFKMGARTHIDLDSMGLPADEVDFIQLETPGDIRFLSWPGAGEASHHHFNGTTKTALGWTPPDTGEHQHVAWWDPELPRGASVVFDATVDLSSLGASREAVVEWFETENLNCSAIAAIQAELRHQVFARIGGISDFVPSPLRG